MHDYKRASRHGFDLRVVVAVAAVDVVVLGEALPNPLVYHQKKRSRGACSYRGAAASITGSPGSDVADLARRALLNGGALLNTAAVLNGAGKGLGEDGREGGSDDEELHLEDWKVSVRLEKGFEACGACCGMLCLCWNDSNLLN